VKGGATGRTKRESSWAGCRLKSRGRKVGGSEQGRSLDGVMHIRLLLGGEKMGSQEMGAETNSCRVGSGKD